MQPWRFIVPDTGGSPCDAASNAHPVLLADDGARAVLLETNPLAEAGAAIPASPAAGIVVLRSGALEPQGPPDDIDEIDRLDAARRTWGPEGRARFDAAWPALADRAADRNLAVWLHPRAGDVVGDVPALRQLALGKIACAQGILFEPAALLTAGMLAEAEDHFDRMLEPIAASGLIRATLITNLAEPHADGPLRRAPIDEGLLDPALLRALAHRAAAIAPLCVLPADADPLSAATDNAADRPPAG